MNIEDLVQLISNRLREFKLSRDYARMSGDLERMNTADKEIISLEDTLFKLNLLIDTSKSAAVKEDILAEVLTDGSVAVLGDYDITPYATDPLHEEKIMNILSKMGVMETAEKIDDYIKGKYLSSPVTGDMVMSAASAYSVDARLMMAIMEQDSSFGTAGVAVRTLNPGNVGNNDAGDTITYESWQEGVTAVAGWLSRHRGSTTISEIPDTSTSTPALATSTPAVIPTPDLVGINSLEESLTPTTTISAATSTPEIIPVTTPVVGSFATTTGQASTTTITIATSTPTTTATTTPAVIPTPDLVGINSVEESLTPTTTTSTPAITTSTTTTTIATSTPTTTASTTPTVIPSPAPEQSSVQGKLDEGSMSTTVSSTPETIPVTTSTTTTTIATSTE